MSADEALFDEILDEYRETYPNHDWTTGAPENDQVLERRRHQLSQVRGACRWLMEGATRAKESTTFVRVAIGVSSCIFSTSISRARLRELDHALAGDARAFGFTTADGERVTLALQHVQYIREEHDA